MSTSLNALLTAWAVTIIIVVGGGLAIELSYDPEATARKQAAPEQTAAVPANHDTGQDTADAEPETSHAAPSSAADADMPAPGQTQPAAESDITMHALPVVAEPALIEDSAQGPLPKVAEDGRRPFDVYSAAPPMTDLPRIAIVVSDLGQRSQITRRAISELPKEVTLAFSPYAANLIDWGERAREAGHEVLLMVPMEPVNYPQNDPGPFTLLTSQPAKENINLLKASMGRLTGYVGIVSHMGSRFTAAVDSIRPVIDELKHRGLMFVDARDSQYSRGTAIANAIGVPSAYANRFIDDDLSTEEIANQLAELEKRARVHGSALGMARPFPVSIDAVKTWAETVQSRGFILVPISAVADRQPPAN